MEESTGENVMVGTAMARRSMYQFGKNLERSPKAMWTRAWAKTWCTAHGHLAPTQLITKPPKKLHAGWGATLYSTTYPAPKPRLK
jgi:alkyl sulfatase BDS1-like metallo-beta-lactamase superfamily hydrolase